jgi:hypothetical protein
MTIIDSSVDTEKKYSENNEVIAPAKPAARRSFVAFIIACFFANLLLVMIVLMLLYPKREKLLTWLQPQGGQGGQVLAPNHHTEEDSKRLKELAARVEAVEHKLQAVEGSNKPSADGDTTSSGNTLEMQEKLSALEAELTTLKQQSPADEMIAPLRDQIQQLTLLQQNLSQQMQLQEATALNSAPALKLMAVFQSLRAQALAGQSFQESLQRFLALAGRYPVLIEEGEVLEPFASAGRPFLRDLQRSFGEALKQYLRTQGGTDNSFMGKVKDNLAQFIVVRKMEDGDNSTLAIINRAEKLLAEDKMEQALTELASLPKDVAPVFAAFVTEAKGYGVIPQQLQKIDQELADMLLQTSAPSAPSAAPVAAASPSPASENSSQPTVTEHAP